MWAGIPTPPMCSTPSCGRDQEWSWTDDLRKWPGKNYCGGRKILVKWLTKLFRKIIWDLLPVYNFDLTSNIPQGNTVVLFVVCKNQIWFKHLNNCLWQASYRYSALRIFPLFFQPLNREDMACWLRVFMNQTSTERLPEGLNKFWVDDESPYHDIQSENMNSPLSDVFPCEMAEEVIWSLNTCR